MVMSKQLTREQMVEWLESIELPAKILAVQIQEDTVVLRKLN